MDQQDLVAGHAERGTGAAPVTGRRVGVEAVVDRRGVDAPLGELAPGQLVDDHVAPGGVDRRQLGDVGEAGPLPGRVMVVEDGRTPPEGLRHHVRRGQVERDRAEVLDDDQVGVQRPGHLGGRGGLRRPDGQARQLDVGRALAGDRAQVEPERLERAPPGLGHDRHSVGAAEAEGDDRGGRHDGWVTVPVPRDGQPQSRRLSP
jgi:hypothetical protein